MYALRRDPRSADNFPRDVRRACRATSAERAGCGAWTPYPGKGSHVPLYILGSSLFGAKLAAALGLPYAFASHFAPGALLDAIAAYRDEFRPSDQLAQPYVMAGVNVIAADTTEEAREQSPRHRRIRAVSLHGRRLGIPEQDVTDEQADEILAAGVSLQVDHMLTYTAAGTAGEVSDYLDEFVRVYRRR